MKIFLNDNVFEAALDRMRYLFDEFPNIVVSTSGGKDSTIITELALMVAREKKRLPLKVLFLDQEAEYRMVIEYLRRTGARKDIELIWIQCPMRLFNATSVKDKWLWCWKEGDEWMREKENGSVQVNNFGTERFHNMFTKILEYYFPDEPACFLTGVRADESPTRLVGLTSGATYKDITWGKKQNERRGHYNFHPIYDWYLSDVWKAINDNGWDYCKIYDEMYRYGVPAREMRVSNLHHETSVHALFSLHEIEPDTWEALTKRLQGINQTKHMAKSDMFAVKDLPAVFSCWKEYRDYLTDKLIPDEEHKASFRKKWAEMDVAYRLMVGKDRLIQKQIGSLLVNDWEFVKLMNFTESQDIITFRRWRDGKDVSGFPESRYKYIPRVAVT